MRESKSPVFEETYRHYLEQLSRTDRASIPVVLGVHMRDGAIWVDFFGKPYRVDFDGVAAEDGVRPTFDICVVLLKYLLLAPRDPVKAKGWIAFREIPGSSPLGSYFHHDVEGSIAEYFSGRVEALKKAVLALSGNPADEELPYDVAITFQALSKIRLLMLFNDSDSEFPAQCSVLFEKAASQFLDSECLAIMATCLARALSAADSGAPYR